MSNPGPCVICGATSYNMSMGGPTICPACDCGDFGMQRVQRQGKELILANARIASLEARLKGCVEALKFYGDDANYLDRMSCFVFTPELMEEATRAEVLSDSGGKARAALTAAKEPDHG